MPGLVVSAFSEGIQHVLPYRTFNVNDVIANVVGIILGTPFLFLHYKRSSAL